MSIPQGQGSPLVIDDRRSGDLSANIGTRWRGFSDRVMGGVSRESVTTDRVKGRPCLRLSGAVSLENNGGFIQMALDLSEAGNLDASRYRAVRIDVYGNREVYNLHLRTDATALPWQSYRASFHAEPRWKQIDIPLESFEPHRLEAPLDTSRLRRIAVVAIGRAFDADVCLASVALIP